VASGGSSVSSVRKRSRDGYPLAICSSWIRSARRVELHKGNVAAGELDFQWSAVMRGAEQHGLVLQGCSCLAIFKHAFDDVQRLIGFVADADKLRSSCAVAFGPEILAKALGRSDRG
jgi:hypothetical protein